MCLGNGKNGWAPTATIIQRVWDWLAAVEAGTGMKPIIYTYPSWFATFSWNDPALTQYPLWIAGSSMGCAQVPAPYTSAVFWQWNTTTGVPGIGTGTSAVDKDRFMGTPAELNGFIAGDVVQPDGGAAMPDAGGKPATLHTLLSGVNVEEPDAAVVDLAMRPPPGHSDGGCGCDVGGAGGNAGAVVAALLLLAAVRRRREPERRSKLL
jgi:MYXO-CTERM domain-containing protein